MFFLSVTLLVSLSAIADALSRADCYLGYDRGPCANSVLQYYYNADRGECMSFIYGGCQGNGNRFDNKANCETACGSSQTTRRSLLSSGSSALDIDYNEVGTDDTTSSISVSSPPAAGSPTFWSCTTPRDQQPPPAQFWMRSSFFHIFRQLKVVCNGVAFKWQVVSRVGFLDGLYLAVWRPLPGNKPLYKLVGMTKVSKMTIKPDVWTDLNIHDRFSVATGDLIGFFYDSWLYTDSLSSIPLMPSTNAFDPASNMLVDETYVAQMQAGDIFNMTSATVDVSSAVKVSRRPAVTLVVDPTGSVKTPETVVTNQNPATINRNFLNNNNNNTGISLNAFMDDGRSENCLDAFRMAGACNYDITSFKTRWYFDQPDARCEMFWYYPDCVISNNIFMTKDACERSCRSFFNVTTPRYFQ